MNKVRNEYIGFVAKNAVFSIIVI